MFNFFKRKEAPVSLTQVEEKKNALVQLNETSISSIAKIQTALDTLVEVNAGIEKTEREIDEIKNQYALLENELATRKNSNKTLVDNIKSSMNIDN